MNDITTPAGFRARVTSLGDERVAAAKTKLKKGRKLTLLAEEKIRTEAFGEVLMDQFDERIRRQDPQDWLTDDPVWNPKHPLYTTVNSLLETGKAKDTNQAIELAKAMERKGVVQLPVDAATQKQVNFIRSLLNDRVYDKMDRVGTVEDNGEVIALTFDDKVVTKKEASLFIDAIKKAPYKPREEVVVVPVEGLDLSAIPTGIYAVPGGDTRLKIRIEQGKGRWEGWTFVKDGAEYGEGKRYGVQRPGEAYKGDIVNQLEAVVADPFEASKAYGKLVGRCGVCGKKLEDADSVALGIGPICREKF